MRFTYVFGMRLILFRLDNIVQQQYQRASAPDKHIVTFKNKELIISYVLTA